MTPRESATMPGADPADDVAEQPPPPGGPPPGGPPPWSAALATVALASGLVVGAIALVLATGGWDTEPVAAGVRLTWWQLALMFAAASVFVAHIEVNDQTHTFSLSEVPLILGLLFAAPEDLVAGRLIGETLVLGLYVRQPHGKLAFNLSVFFAETCLATQVYALLSPQHGGLNGATATAAFVAAAVAGQFSATSVWAVIRIHDGSEHLVRLLVVGVVTTVANASLAVVAAALAVTAPWAMVPLLVVCAVVVAAYRAYARLSRRYGGLRSLYEFSATTSGSLRHDETVGQVLEEARRLMRAGVAVVLVDGNNRLSRNGDHRNEDRQVWQVTRSPALPEDGVPPQLAHLAPPIPVTTSPAPEAPPRQRRPGRRRPRPKPGRLPDWVRDRVLDGNTVLIRAGTENHRERALLAEFGVADLVAAPMVSGGKVEGVLVAADRLSDVLTFDGDDALLLATLARQAAVALQNAALIEQLHEQVLARENDALHDSLTGLPNRASFLRSLEAALSRPPGPAGTQPTAVLLMDLNGFKEVNDTLGHRTGDRLLVEVAERLRTVVPAGSTVARLGGDEFAIVLQRSVQEEVSPRELVAMAEGLGAMLREPFTLDELTLEVGASIGVAIAPDHSNDALILLQRADVAMYAAKNAHLPVALYNPDADWHTQDRLRLALELRRAIESRRLAVAYQPIARADDGRVTDVEALARWDHAELGSIGPDTFVPVAERTGLIHELTWHVLDLALAQVRTWRADGVEVRVNVNLSVQLLRDRELPAKIAQALARHDVPPEALTLEMTETGIMTDPGSMIRTLEDLVATGVSLAIDDFGTGHSSLAYLQRLPMSKVKIDKSLVGPMAEDPNALTIVRSVIDLAHNLDLHAVAEGVEDGHTLELLTRLGCDFIQGHHLSPPIPAADVRQWLPSSALPPTRGLLMGEPGHHAPAAPGAP